MKKTSEEVGGGKSETLKDTNPMSSLRAKLRTVDPEIQHCVTALEAEDLRLQKQIAKMQAENVTLNSRITILEENLEDVKRQNEATAIGELVKMIREERDKK